MDQNLVITVFADQPLPPVIHIKNLYNMIYHIIICHLLNEIITIDM